MFLVPQTAISLEEDANAVLREALKFVFFTAKAKIYICQNATALAWNYTDTLVKDLHGLHKYPRTYVNIQVNGSTNDSAISVINTGVKNISKVCKIICYYTYPVFHLNYI